MALRAETRQQRRMRRVASSGEEARLDVIVDRETLDKFRALMDSGNMRRREVIRMVVEDAYEKQVKAGNIKVRH